MLGNKINRKNIEIDHFPFPPTSKSQSVKILICKLIVYNVDLSKSFWPNTSWNFPFIDVQPIAKFEKNKTIQL